jgi:hypothetical protein
MAICSSSRYFPPKVYSIASERNEWNWEERVEAAAKAHDAGGPAKDEPDETGISAVTP